MKENEDVNKNTSNLYYSNSRYCACTCICAHEKELERNFPLSTKMTCLCNGK